MDRLWEDYLSTTTDLDSLTHLVVYTDTFRYWLASGLLDLAERLELNISLQLLESIEDEEGMEIRQSLAYLPDSTLLAVFFSDRNPVIAELNHIFPLLTTPAGFSGHYLIAQQHLPDQYFASHLQANLFRALDREDELRDHINNHLRCISETGTILEADVDSLVSFPYFGENNHLILPSTELVIELGPASLDGVAVISQTIGEYLEEGEIVDPFGLVGDPLTLLIEDGQITGMQGNDLLVRRLSRLISLPFSPDRVQLSVGLGPELAASGIIEHDRLLWNVATLSLSISVKDSYLEFVLGEVTFTDKNR